MSELYLVSHKICMYVAGRPTFISLCAELLIGSATAFMSFLWPTFDEMFPPSNYKGYNESTNKSITHGDIFLLSKFHRCHLLRHYQVIQEWFTSGSNRAPNRQFFPQKFSVKSESTPVFLSKNLSLERKVATNLNSRQKYAFRTNIEFSRKCIHLQLKPI